MMPVDGALADASNNRPTSQGGMSFNSLASSSVPRHAAYPVGTNVTEEERLGLVQRGADDEADEGDDVGRGVWSEGSGGGEEDQVWRQHDRDGSGDLAGGDVGRRSRGADSLPFTARLGDARVADHSYDQPPVRSSGDDEGGAAASSRGGGAFI